MTSVFAPSMAQDVKSQVEAIKKVVTDNKSNPAAAEEQVKDFVKENKKNAEALAGLGRAYFEIKDTASAREYAMMAIDRGKDDKGKALAYILLGDIAALSDEGGGAASQYNQAMLLDPQNPTGYIKYAAVYRKVDPEGSVAVLEKLRQVQPDYPVGVSVGEVAVMRHHYNKPGFCHFFQQFHYLNAGYAVQRAGRLIGKDNIRIVYKRPGYCDALHLSARKLIRLFVELRFQPDFFQRLLRPGSALRGAYPAQRQRQFHIFDNGQVRNQVVVLKDEAYGRISVSVPIGIDVFFC